MKLPVVAKAKLVHLPQPSLDPASGLLLLILVLMLAMGAMGAAQAKVHAPGRHRSRAAFRLASYTLPVEPAPPVRQALVWDGRDLDGDGAPDFANPTGGQPRGHDAYGDGFFHASRDGGSRPHEGVDYDARPGQLVSAPISGVISRIGFAYPGDTHLKYVEIENPALNLTARALYIDPSVSVGDTVTLGAPIGHALSLQRRYPGITNHVHLEIAEQGRRIDASTVIFARRADDSLMAAMN